MTDILRTVRAILRCLQHVTLGALKLALVAPRWSDAQRASEAASWARGVLSILGVSLVVRGTLTRAMPERGVLLASNHVSWLDIFVLLACADTRFVAKSEVRTWPLAGWMAMRLGTLFIRRGQRGGAYMAATATAEQLARGRNVCIFPEGTTTDGRHLHPFQSALFSPAAQGGARVQPVAIRYRDASGALSDAAAFTGDMTLFRSLMRLVVRRDVVGELVFLAPIDTPHDRRALGALTERAVAVELGLAVAARGVAPQRAGIAAAPSPVPTAPDAERIAYG